MERIARRKPWSTAARSAASRAGAPGAPVVMALVLAVVVSQAIVLVAEVARVL